MRVDFWALAAKLSSRQRHLVAAVILVLAAALAATALRAPFTALQNTRAARLSIEQVLGSEAALKQVSAQLDEDMAKLALVAPSMQEPRTVSQLIVDVVAELNRLSTRTGVTIHSITPGTARKTATFEELPFNVEVAGEYRDLVNWLVGAEQTLRTLGISSMDSRRDEASGLTFMHLELAVYRDISE